MLKMLQAISSLIKDAIEIVEKARGYFDEKSKRQLAQSLHLVYIRLNDCLTIGEEIVSVLERFAQNPRQLLRSRKYEIWVEGVLLQRLLDRQVQNLDALGEALRDYSEIMKALDAELFVRLQQFVAFKGVGLHWVATLLEQGQIPFDALGLDDITHLARLSSFMLAKEGDTSTESNPIDEAVTNFLPWYDEVSVLSRRIDEGSLELKAVFNHEADSFDGAVKMEQLERLRAFLARNELRHHLEQGKAELRAIKAFIETTFSVRELMLDVGSEQLKQKPRW
jgi:hypothetical protein